MDIYKTIIRPILFSGLKIDPETAHQQTLAILSWVSNGEDSPLARWMASRLEASFSLGDNRLQQTIWGLKFPNPLGLAAGFDKDGVGTRIWGNLGFGFAELGTVTFHPQSGNPPPRLFRLVQDLAALNRMGFNNQGASALASRLSLVREKSGISIPIGINLGKSKITPLDDAAADYLGSFRLLQDLGDYFVVNVSSPNTPGLRSLQDSKQLSLILDGLQQENQGQKPILVKIAPDLEWDAIADVIHIAQTYQLAGIVATNTTIRRDMLKTKILETTGKPLTEEAGGISGVPIRDRATDVIRFIYQQTQGNLPIIGVGGIFTARDAWDKIAAGASLIQVYTGWIYEGPWMVKNVMAGLLQMLAERNLERISDAVGFENISVDT